jgi:stage II sporulation protein E
MVSVMGCYPLVPAFYASVCPEYRTNLPLFAGLLAGLVFHMPVGAMIRYLFLLILIGTGLRFFTWANRRCGNGVRATVAFLATALMGCSKLSASTEPGRTLAVSLCESVTVAGLTLIFGYFSRMAEEIPKAMRQKGTDTGEYAPEPVGKILAFADAMDGLSEAFAEPVERSEMSGSESMAVLEREIAGKLCADCDGCAICMEAGNHDRSLKIRRMLQAVISHSPKEEIISMNYVDECPRYPGMVEEAIWAFSRMELNEAWYKRLRENRRVIAGQLDAMALTMQDWGKGKDCLDKKSALTIAKIAYEARERGIVAEKVHIYEDGAHRKQVTATVASKWGGGIPARQYLRALERALGISLRLQRDARTILTREPVQITAYEDTCFDLITGTACEMKDGAGMSGDNLSVFTVDEGLGYVCLSDGMGSGPAAGKESDMVVDLMEKFMEAGFSEEAAIRIMNSAMVLKGEDEAYTTLDFARIDLYTGMLELTKIGAAASFIRHGKEVECLSVASLPAGAYANEPCETIERKLRHGDFLVMVTDGVLEYLHVKKPEDKVAALIGEIVTDNAQTLADNLLSRILLFNGGHAPDDMTIAVTGIWEK